MKTTLLSLLAAATLATVAGPAAAAATSSPATPQRATAHAAHRTVSFKQCRRGGGYPIFRGHWWCVGGRYGGQRIG